MQNPLPKCSWISSHVFCINPACRFFLFRRRYWAWRSIVTRQSWRVDCDTSIVTRRYLSLALSTRDTSSFVDRRTWRAPTSSLRRRRFKRSGGARRPSRKSLTRVWTAWFTCSPTGTVSPSLEDLGGSAVGRGTGESFEFFFKFQSDSLRGCFSRRCLALKIINLFINLSPCDSIRLHAVRVAIYKVLKVVGHVTAVSYVTNCHFGYFYDDPTSLGSPQMSLVEMLL